MKLLHAFTGVLLMTAPALAQTTTPTDPFEGVSIFSRLRGTVEPTTRGVEGTGRSSWTTQAAQTPLFVGTMQDGERIIALLEVEISGRSTLLHLKEGDIVPWDQSRVLHISEGAIQLSSSSPMPRIIALGNNLLNQPITISQVPGVRSLGPTISPPARIRRGTPLGTGPATR